MQAVPPSSFLLRSIVLATLGLLPLGLMAASAQTPRTRAPAPADANRPANPPASLDMLKERDEERAAGTQERLDVLDDKEQALRTSLRERRGLIAEVLAALQRIGRQTPPAL